jgi:hypothetical protein
MVMWGSLARFDGKKIYFLDWEWKKNLRKMIEPEPITKNQIKAIHTLKSKLNWDDRTYRSFLIKFANCYSSKELTKEKASEIIDLMSQRVRERN